MINYSFVKVSQNKKVGPMPVVMASRNTCPPSCEMMESCYAKFSFTGIHWRKLDDKGLDFDTLLNKIGTIAKRAIWRYGIAGDLPGDGTTLDVDKMSALAKANKGKHGYAYTHYPVTKENVGTLAMVNARGFTVNLSANNLDQVDDYIKTGLPVVTVLPQDAPDVSYTEQGNKVVVCPQQQNPEITCQQCEICAKPERNYVIGFKAHGTSKKKAEAVFFKGHKLISK